MKLAVMQPYFLPYIGYWQLIHASDTFVLLDDVQYIRHGWVNRNRILRPGGGWQYIVVPLQKHSMTDPIREIITSGGQWKDRVLRQLRHYRHELRAPHYEEVSDFLGSALASAAREERLAKVNEVLVREVCAYLGLGARIALSSESGLSYEAVQDAGDWALVVARQLNASEYINPAGGAALFEPGRFAACGIALSFLTTGDIFYAQGPPREANQSIVDVLMFNGRDGTRKLLERYTVERARSSSPASATRD